MWVFEGFLLAGCQVFVGFAQCYGSWPETRTNDLKEGSPINFINPVQQDLKKYSSSM